ncbi:ArsR/SmtB family transcription factor [Nocardia brasiliensis]
MSAAQPPLQVLSALSEPTRWQILDILGSGAASASVLARQLPVTRTAVLKHLEVLERCELVTRARVGKEVRYAVHAAPLHAAAEWMSVLARNWDARLERLRRLAEQE